MTATADAVQDAGEFADEVDHADRQHAVQARAIQRACFIERTALLDAPVVDIDDGRGGKYEAHVRETLGRLHHALDAERVQQVVIEQGLDVMALGAIHRR